MQTVSGLLNNVNLASLGGIDGVFWWAKPLCLTALMTLADLRCFSEARKHLVAAPPPLAAPRGAISEVCPLITRSFCRTSAVISLDR